MPEILFFNAKTQFKLKHPKKTTLWLIDICEKEGREIESLHYIFCSDNYLRDLNIQYLKHNTYTDILSFDNSSTDKIEGEIYISIQRVKENARIFNQPVETEIRRVVSHGLLHFLGYKDKTKSQKAEMRLKEEACLSLWK